MDLEQLLRAEYLARRAHRLGADEQARYLAAECGDDSALRSEVEFLIAARCLEGPAVAEIPESDATVRLPGEGLVAASTVEASSVESPSADFPTRRIGDYRLVEPIGQGGFGVVYLAEQERPVRRRVALKIIKLGMDTREIVARFEAERQALAMMEHPAVARVYDAGATENGRPYFVMEYVQGVSITDYCDRNRLTTAERLELFIQVCDAVQHAHHKGIIHRDLKPTNILVSIVDGLPSPKVIDFGIAKALHQRLTDRTLHTERGQLIGTPEYMSPEQAEMSGLDVDTRTDIYSLGIVLYQLLVGSLPLESDVLRRGGPAEILRILRDHEPPRPSTRLSGLRSDAATVAANRRTDVPTLTRQLRGDLDWIVLKAMEKDRGRRYASASEFAADVQRYLRNEPVLACPPSAVYRLQKFVRRNRPFVIAAGLVFAALVVAVVGTGVGLARALRAEAKEKARAEEAELSRHEAQAEAAKSKAVTKFLTDDLFFSIDPDLGRGPRVTVMEALDAAALQVPRSLEDHPQIEVAVLTAIGAMYSRLGMFTKAEPQLQRAIDLGRKKLGPEHAETLAAVYELLYLSGASAVKDEKTIALGERLVETRKRLLGSDNPETIDAVHALAIAYSAAGRFDDSARLGNESLSRYESVFGAKDIRTLDKARHYCLALTNAGRYADAIQTLDGVAAKMHEVVGPEDLRYLAALQMKGVILSLMGKYEDAAACLRFILEIQTRLQGRDSMARALTLSALGRLYLAMGRLDESAPMLEESLPVLTAGCGQSHPLVIATTQALINIHIKSNQLKIAEDELMALLKSADDSSPNSRQTRAMTYLQLARVRRLSEKFDEAEEHYRHAVQIAGTAYPPGSLEPLHFNAYLGQFLAERKRFAESEPLLITVLDQFAAALPEDSAFVQRSLTDLVTLYEAWGKPEQASAFRARLKPAPAAAATSQPTSAPATQPIAAIGHH